MEGRKVGREGGLKGERDGEKHEQGRGSTGVRREKETVEVEYHYKCMIHMHKHILIN